MLILKYNDNYDLFDEDERSEFIFRIFKHVVLSGDTEQVCVVWHDEGIIIIKFITFVARIKYTLARISHEFPYWSSTHTHMHDVHACFKIVMSFISFCP
jgi:metal-responsive CopG/Arc/MetJ family transcriptional regulator